MDEIADYKRRHLEQKRIDRDERNDSILDNFDFDTEEAEQGVIKHCSDASVSLEDKPPECPTCNGKGWVQSLFSRWECDACFGTTYDLSNPVAIIKWQRLCMEWAKKDVIKSRLDLQTATMSNEQKEAKAIDDFYQTAKRKD